MLKAEYQPTGKEKVGFILHDGTIVEVMNIHPSPELHFEVSADDLLRFEDSAQATWHTHPNGDANLSNDDYLAFLAWPQFTHYIVGSDGVRAYKALPEQGIVVCV